MNEEKEINEENVQEELPEQKDIEEEIKDNEAEKEVVSENSAEEVSAEVEAETEINEVQNNEIVGATVDLSSTEIEKADDITGTYNGVNTTLETSIFNPIHFTHDGTLNIDDEFNSNREKFNSQISKSRFFDILAIVLMLLAFVAVLLVTFLNKGDNAIAWLTWLILGISFAIIIFSFILTSIVNRKNAKVTKEYLNSYEDMLNGYVISDLTVLNPTLCVDAKVNDQDIIQAHYFRTINRIESRAVVEGKRKGYDFSIAEVAVVIPTISIESANKKPEDLVNLDGSKYIASEIPETELGTQEVSAPDMTMIDLKLNAELAKSNGKQREKDIKKANENKQTETATGLFGKIYSYSMKVKSEEAIIISFTGNSDSTVLPDYLTGFKAIKVPGLKASIVVYAVDPKESAKFFNEEGVKLLNDIYTGMVVQSLFISINSYGTKIGMNLSDDIMQLPIKRIAHLGSYAEYKSVTDSAFKFVDYVAEKAGN